MWVWGWEDSLLGGVPQMAAQMSAYAKENYGCTSVRNQVVPVLCLFQTAECHLGAGDVFLGVLEVFELYEQISHGFAGEPGGLRD